MKKSVIVSVLIFLILWNSPASAEIGYGDTVLDFYDAGTGPINGPYGGVFNFVDGPTPVSLNVVLGSDGTNPDYLSLPTGSYVTVGFTDELVYDRPGDDIYIQEVGVMNETANVYVSEDDTNYIFLGTANDATITSFDLATIGFSGIVTSVKIVGNNLGSGGSPGFDVANVQVPQLTMYQIIKPNGGEEIIAGSTFNILWENNNSAQVNLELSTNNGMNWSTISTNITNDGLYEWIVPIVTSNECLIRISDPDNMITQDISNATFIIYECQLSSLADFNNDCIVDLTDLQFFASEWLKCGNPFNIMCD